MSLGTLTVLNGVGGIDETQERNHVFKFTLSVDSKGKLIM